MSRTCDMCDICDMQDVQDVKTSTNYMRMDPTRVSREINPLAFTLYSSVPFIFMSSLLVQYLFVYRVVNGQCRCSSLVRLLFKQSLTTLTRDNITLT